LKFFCRLTSFFAGDKRFEQLQQYHQALQEAWDAFEFTAAERDPLLTLFDSTKLSEARLAAYDAALKAASNERRLRESTIAKQSNRIAELFGMLCEQLNASSALDAAVLDRSVSASLGCGRRVLEQLAARLSALEAKREEREERVRAFAFDITALWDRLGVSDEERDDFYEQHQGLGPDVLEACATELTRLRVLKQGRMHELVAAVRQRIAALWQKLGFSEQQCGTFYRQYYLTDRCDDDVLDAHEMEERQLNERLEQLAPILAVIDEREALLDEKRQMDLLASDPERLTSRRRDPGRLLREEKFRKRFAKLLPVCEQRLDAMVADWEQAHPDEAPFLWKGEPFRNQLETVYGARRAVMATHYAASTAASSLAGAAAAATVQQTPTATRARAHTTPSVTAPHTAAPKAHATAAPAVVVVAATPRDAAPHSVAGKSFSTAAVAATPRDIPRTPLSAMPQQHMNTRARAGAGEEPKRAARSAAAPATTLRAPTTVPRR
jgi:hypothetical protein